MITERGTSVIPFRPAGAASVGEGAFHLDAVGSARPASLTPG